MNEMDENLDQEEARLPVGPGVAEPPWDIKDAARALLLLAAFIVLVGFALYSISRPPTGPGNRLFEGAMTSALLLLQSAMMIYVSWWFGVRKYRTRLEELGLRDFQLLRALYYSFIFLIPLYIFEFVYGYVIQEYFGAELPQIDYIGLLGGGAFGLVAAAFLVIVMAPVAEEIFFRGFLYPAVKKKFGLITGIAVSALVFGAFHLDVWLIIPVGLIGAYNAWLYERTGSLDSCIILHSVNNLVALILLITQGG